MKDSTQEKNKTITLTEEERAMLYAALNYYISHNELLSKTVGEKMANNLKQNIKVAKDIINKVY